MDDKKPTSTTDHFEDDPDAPASEEERALSSRLRDALEDPSKANEGADIARALSLAFEPREIPAGDHQALLDAATSNLRAKPKSGPDNVVAVSFGATRRGRATIVGVATAVSLAAGAILLIGQMTSTPNGAVATSSRPQLLQTRSTQSLFEEPFARTGGSSARIDRIAMARSSDLRNNRFAKWGVR